MEGEENILNQKLLEGEENIKLNNHVFPPIFYFFLTSSLIFSFSCAFIPVICSWTLSQTIFVVTYFWVPTHKKKKEEEEEKKKRKKIVGRKQKIYSSEKRTQERPKNGPRLVEKV